MTLAAPFSYSAGQALADLDQVAPLVAVVVTLVLAILIDLLLPPRARGQAVAVVAAAGLTVAAGVAIFRWFGPAGHSAYFGFATGDKFAIFFEGLFAVLGVLTVAAAHTYLRRRRFLEAEFHVLTLAAVAGMMVMGSATSLVTVFLGLELLSIALYVMCGWDRRARSSQEAAAKYLLVGGFASAFVLYGMALVYGATGSTLLHQIAQRATAAEAANPLVLLGILLMGVGFAFKVSAAPFHMWTPDVYQGAPLPVTAFMSTGTKAAAFAMIIRVFAEGLPQQGTEWQALLAFVAATSMVVGNLMAIAQSSLKRLLAYSGVAHAGYILIGVLAGGRAGLAAVLFYLGAYLFMNFGAFGVAMAVSGPEGDRDLLSDLDGLGRRQPLLAVLMSVFMFSLAGFPPTVGFMGKLFLFAAGVSAGYTWLVVLAVLMSAVSAYYYIWRVLSHVWAPEPAAAHLPSRHSALAVVTLAGLVSLGLFVYPTFLLIAGQWGAGAVLAAGR